MTCKDRGIKKTPDFADVMFVFPNWIKLWGKLSLFSIFLPDSFSKSKKVKSQDHFADSVAFWVGMWFLRIGIRQNRENVPKESRDEPQNRLEAKAWMFYRTPTAISF